MVSVFYFYSVLNASTGSLFAAIFDGISPAIKVKSILIATRITPAAVGKYAAAEIADRLGCESLIYEKLGHATYEEAPDFNKRVYNFFVE